MHEMMLKGTGEKELQRELKSKITKGKIKVVSDLDSTKQALSLSEKNLKRQEEQNHNLADALRRNIKKSESEKYDEEEFMIDENNPVEFECFVYNNTIQKKKIKLVIRDHYDNNLYAESKEITIV